jgi:hypothetical protein
MIDSISLRWRPRARAAATGRPRARRAAPYRSRLLRPGSDMLVLRGQLCLVLVQLLAMPGLPTALSLDIAP